MVATAAALPVRVIAQPLLHARIVRTDSGPRAGHAQVVLHDKLGEFGDGVRDVEELRSVRVASGAAHCPRKQDAFQEVLVRVIERHVGGRARQRPLLAESQTRRPLTQLVAIGCAVAIQAAPWHAELFRRSPSGGRNWLHVNRDAAALVVLHKCSRARAVADAASVVGVVTTNVCFFQRPPRLLDGLILTTGASDVT